MRKTGYPAAARCWRSRAAREGSSYHVRVSLCRSGMMIYRQGKLDDVAADLDLSPEELDGMRIESHPKSGPLRHLGPAVQLSETPPRSYLLTASTL